MTTPTTEAAAWLAALVAPGGYATEVGGVLRFFVVQVGERVAEQRGGDLYPLGGKDRAEALDAIRADPAARARYGREIGSCGVCGRALTNGESRALGIGPVCGGRAH